MRTVAYVHPNSCTKLPPAFHLEQTLERVAELLRIHGSVEAEGICRNAHSPAFHVVDEVEGDDFEITPAS